MRDRDFAELIAVWWGIIQLVSQSVYMFCFVCWRTRSFLKRKRKRGGLRGEK